MRGLWTGFGLIRALLPVLYCGGLLYYFMDTGGSLENIQDIGLGPTVLGLAVVGLLFCIPLTLKIVKLVAGSRPPGSGPDEPPDDGGFDPDAAIARYMATRSTQGYGKAVPARPGQQGGGRTKPSAFGRRR